MKRTLTSIAAAGVVLGSFVPAAFAATTSHKVVVTKAPSYNSRTVSLGSYNANVKGIAAKDGSVTTEFLPVWYVQQGLKALGYTATWDGNNMILNITTPDGVTPDTSNPVIGTGDIAIQINGTMVQSAPHLVAKDPASKVNTTYVPVWYLEQVMKRLNFINSYDGHTWKEVANDFAISGANTIAVGGKDTLSLTSKTQTVDASKVTWTVDGNGGAVVDANGNFIASAAGTYNVTASYEGVTATAKVVVYGAVAGFKIAPASASLVANNASTDVVTITAVDASGNAVGNYTGTATVGISGGAAIFATGTAQNTDFDGATLTFANGVGQVVLAAQQVPGLTSTLTVTSGSLKDANGAFLTGNTTITSVAQVATAVAITPDSKFLSANDNGSTAGVADQATVEVGVNDQTGNPMLTGSYGVQLNVAGPATFTDATTGPDYVTVGGNVTVPVTLDALKGQTGTVTVTGSSTGLTSGTGTVTAIIGQNAAKLAVAPTVDGVTSFTEGPGNSVSYTVSATDVNGAPATYNFGTGTVKVYVTDSKGNNAANILVNGTASSTSGVALTNGTISLSDINGSNADAGTYTVTVKDTATTGTLAAAPSFNFTENAGAAVAYTITAGAPEVSVGSPTTTDTIQFVDAFGNKVAPTTPVTFKVTGAEQTNAGVGYGTATINGVDSATGVYVQSNSTGAATVTFVAQPYAGADWKITATPQAPSVLGAQSNDVTVANSIAATATASVVDLGNSNSPTNGKAGDSLKYTFGAKDSLGNAIASGDDFTVTYKASQFSGIGTTNLTAGTDANGNATLTGMLSDLNNAFASVTDKAAGTVSLSVTDATISTTSASASIFMNAGTQAAGVYDLFDANGNNVTLNGLSTTAETPVELWIKAVDNYGNAVVNGTAATVALTDPNGGSFRATQNGSPVADFQIANGSYGLGVWYVNPATATFTTGATGAATTAAAPTITANNTVVAGSNLVVSGTVVDGLGNPYVGPVTVSFDGQTVTAATSSTGAYSVTLTPTAATAGATISVTANGQTATQANVAVTPAAVASVTVTPATQTIAQSAGGTQQYTAVEKDQYGNTITGGTINWTITGGSSAPATIDNTGLVTVTANTTDKATYTVTATDSVATTVSGTATLTVN